VPFLIEDLADVRLLDAFRYTGATERKVARRAAAAAVERADHVSG